MQAFDEKFIQQVVALQSAKSGSDAKFWSASEIFARLDAAIIGNDGYKKSLAMALADYLGANGLRNHLLVAGPSGTGKTYLLQQCLPDFGLPFVVIDGSGLTPSGYKGQNLSDSLGEFFRSNAMASRKCVIVLDEFDKISDKANGGDVHKSQSIQSELLTLIQGKNEGGIDTRNALWILAGAFAYTDEMRGNPPRLAKSELLKYGFKNELLGRIAKITMTDIPTIEQVVRRIAKAPELLAFMSDLAAMGYDIDFAAEAFYQLAAAAQNPAFGMRAIPSCVAELKQNIVFGGVVKGKFLISKSMIENALQTL
ncbi:MAG: AAA family ATPase [Alphaproteobacteria bacterium]|nr:AAA family ATPase [Alphaproteobacteria bacterium]